MRRNARHIVPDGEGGWKSVDPRSGRSTHHPTQRAAEQAAKQDLRSSGGGEAVIHGTDGRIRDSDTVAPGHDPFPPRDAR